MMTNQSLKRRQHWNSAPRAGLRRQALVCCDDVSKPLKELPLSMQQKFSQRKKRRSGEKELSGWEHWTPSQQFSCLRLSQETHNLLSTCQLWKSSLNEIEGYFGSGILSYFILLRFLFFLNLLFVLLFIGFVFVPISFFTKTPETPAVKVLNQTIDTQCKNFSSRARGGTTSTDTVFQDIFTGEGVLERSFLFYGHYKFWETTGYSISMAYLLSTLGYLMLCFILVGRRMVDSWIQKQGHSRYYMTTFCSRIFASWDFCICSMDAVSLKQQSISNCLKMELQEVSRHQQKQRQSSKEKALLTIIRLLLNVLILVLMAAAFYCIYLATAVSQDSEQQNDSFSLETFSRRVLTQYLPLIVISLVNLLLPYVFGVLVRYEGHSPSIEVNLTLLRSVLLKLASLGMFLFSLGQKVFCIGNKDDSSCVICGYNQLYQCWETSIGQEMYKMSVFNFLSTIGVTLLISLPRR